MARPGKWRWVALAVGWLVLSVVGTVGVILRGLASDLTAKGPSHSTPEGAFLTEGLSVIAKLLIGLGVGLGGVVLIAAIGVVWVATANAAAQRKPPT
jgi:hypothetical protein